jgi:hypothetical protein
LLSHAQEPLIHNDVAAEGLVAEKLAAGEFLERVGQELRKCLDAGAFTMEAGI